jgi:hypothetical protein
LLALPGSIRYTLLGFGLAGALSCGSGRPAGDAGADRVVVEDVRRDGATDGPVADGPARDTAADAAGDRALADQGVPGDPDLAVADMAVADAACAQYSACIPADGNAKSGCESSFVCTGREPCAAGCRECVGLSPRYCLPDRKQDGGPDMCDPFVVCKASECPSGCVGLA